MATWFINSLTWIRARYVFFMTISIWKKMTYVIQQLYLHRRNPFFVIHSTLLALPKSKGGHKVIISINSSNFAYAIDCRYIAALYNTIMHIVRLYWWNYCETTPHTSAMSTINENGGYISRLWLPTWMKLPLFWQNWNISESARNTTLIAERWFWCE